MLTVSEYVLIFSEYVLTLMSRPKYVYTAADYTCTCRIVLVQLTVMTVNYQNKTTLAGDVIEGLLSLEVVPRSAAEVLSPCSP